MIIEILVHLWFGFVDRLLRAIDWIESGIMNIIASIKSGRER